MSKKIAVIGLGNTLRRDDGIGIAVLEDLLAFHRREGVDYLNFGIASFDLLGKVSDYDALLLIDGIDAASRPGELKIFKPDEIGYTSKSPKRSSHELNLKSIFDLCERLDLKARIYVAGIQVEDVAHGEGLTPALAKKRNKIAKDIDSFIGEVLLRCQ